MVGTSACGFTIEHLLMPTDDGVVNTLAIHPHSLCSGRYQDSDGSIVYSEALNNFLLYILFCIGMVHVQKLLVCMGKVS